MTAGDPIRQILRFQIESLKDANHELRETNLRLINERDVLLMENERLRMDTPDELMWKRYDEMDRADLKRWFWMAYGVTLISLGLALIAGLWVMW